MPNIQKLEHCFFQLPYHLELPEFTNPTNSASLVLRKKEYEDCFQQNYHAFREQIAIENLANLNSIEISSKLLQWVDNWMHFTWHFVLIERESLLTDLKENSEQEKKYYLKDLERKTAEVQSLHNLLFEQEKPVPMEAAEHEYYKKSYHNSKQQLKDLEEKLEDISIDLPANLESWFQLEEIEKLLVIFARGGYGRGELSFLSDIDLGYCLDIKKTDRSQRVVLHEFIKRMEELFQTTGIDIASQYLELGENLSRFQKTGALHTFPALLEGRTLIGNSKILLKLKKESLDYLPEEKFIRYIKNQVNELKQTPNYEQYVKEGVGGLREFHFALWLVAAVTKSLEGNTESILDTAIQNSWILPNDYQALLDAREFYMDLRNFRGLFPEYHEKLREIGAEDLVHAGNTDTDLWEDHTFLAYLKLRDRFFSIDFMDRYRLQVKADIQRHSAQLMEGVLDRYVVEKVSDFYVIKNLLNLEITHITMNQPENEVPELVEIRGLQKKPIHKEFDQPERLLELMVYISQKGAHLSNWLIDQISEFIEPLYRMASDAIDQDIVKQSIHAIFSNEYTSIAVETMMDIAASNTRDGHAKTLLGRFLPPVNEMRFLLRNVKVHAWPLCIHSIKTIKRLEKEITLMQKKEPELWDYVDEKDIFALKWSMFFHDLGKIDPYKNHEEYGPVLSDSMLEKIGFESGYSRDMIRLLIRHHQSVTRLSHLSTYMDQAIIRFFELGQRNPKKIILLYLINLADVKSVSDEVAKKTGRLEKLFEESKRILYEFHGNPKDVSINKLVNDYLKNKKGDLRKRIENEWLLSNCLTQGLDVALINPLKQIQPDAAESLQEKSEQLNDMLSHVSQGSIAELYTSRPVKRFVETIRDTLHDETFKLLDTASTDLINWFMVSFPNRFLLSFSPSIVSEQISQFQDFRNAPAQFSFIPGGKGEYDTILFYNSEDNNFLMKVAYSLSLKGINIENGKVNRIVYANNQSGYAGFLQVSGFEQKSRFPVGEILNSALNTDLSKLQFKSTWTTMSPGTDTRFFHERDKGYCIHEQDSQFVRVPQDYVTLKVSTVDSPYSLLKIMKALQKKGIAPNQVTITTIGQKIIDYFYITRAEKEILEKSGFTETLKMFMSTEVSTVSL